MCNGNGRVYISLLPLTTDHPSTSIRRGVSDVEALADRDAFYATCSLDIGTCRCIVAQAEAKDGARKIYPTIKKHSRNRDAPRRRIKCK
ncbi:hypothetical protein PUN28_018484 [Cardiocondyla obscurior]|uniref:Uncharacterized protein n=1 Tax=Cardiocondyla obscurior TaxID=286306 RepID=A0AAW2EJY1_9HYME